LRLFRAETQPESSNDGGNGSGSCHAVTAQIAEKLNVLPTPLVPLALPDHPVKTWPGAGVAVAETVVWLW